MLLLSQHGPSVAPNYDSSSCGALVACKQPETAPEILYGAEGPSVRKRTLRSASEGYFSHLCVAIV
jgi:hypothetical protein